MTAINQKEYLKKYLGIGKVPGEKKKKKKKRENESRIKIIDDDLESSVNLIEEDPFGQNEDAPQIVAIIDERPPSLRVDEKTKDNLWKPIEPATRETQGHELSIGKFKLSEKVESSKKRRDQERSDRSDDFSPPRRTTRPIEIDDDYSPPRKNNANRNVSPSRKRSHKSYDKGSPARTDDNSPPRRSIKIEKVDDDYSPPKKRNVSPPSSIQNLNDCSSPRRRIKTEKLDEDYSPPRKNNKNINASPRRKSRFEDISPNRPSISSGDVSPPRRPSGSNNSTHKHTKRKDLQIVENSIERPSKMKKTLDGKAAGLQNANELVEETNKFKQREDMLLKNMSAHISGENASTVIRDRKTGKIRDAEQEFQIQKLKEAEENKKKEKYSRWGRGLKQIEDVEKRAAEILHEMSKPLARYADDEDLEKYLKEQERDGDPMLAYMRAKKRKKAVEQGHSEKPQYMGEFLPNRYGILPGHRWDGVDRSNGFETKWFKVQNEKKANLEETYRWCSEDM